MAEAKVTREEISEEKQARDFLNEKVTIRLFKDAGKYKEDMTVCVNGRIWKIKRGIEVEIPRYVYFVIMDSMKQGEAYADLIEKGQNEYEEKKKHIDC